MEKLSSTHEVPMGTLYDLNKQAMMKLPKMSESEIQEIKKSLIDWFNWRIDGYAMLLCRERYDFTIFHLYKKANVNPPKVAVDELIDLLKSRGKILSIEKDTNVINNAWEIWLKIDNQPFAYYLFGCDDWVIEC